MAGGGSKDVGADVRSAVGVPVRSAFLVASGAWPPAPDFPNCVASMPDMGVVVPRSVSAREAFKAGARDGVTADEVTSSDEICCALTSAREEEAGEGKAGLRWGRLLFGGCASKEAFWSTGLVDTSGIASASVDCVSVEVAGSSSAA